MDNHDPAQDPAEYSKHFILDDGLKIDAVKKNPYGFWSFKYTKGAIPDDLKGSYTSFNMLEKALKSYVIETKRKIVQVLPGPSTEQLYEGAEEKDIYNPPKPRFKTKHDTLSFQA